MRAHRSFALRQVLLLAFGALIAASAHAHPPPGTSAPATPVPMTGLRGWDALGVGVSLILWILASRKTFGARQERIQAANLDLEHVLIRRIALEDYAPTEHDLRDLVFAKAREFRVTPDALHSETSILRVLCARLLESDLLATAQRKIILARLRPIIELAESATRLATGTPSTPRQPWAGMILLGVATAIVGSLVPVVLRLGVGETLPNTIPMLAVGAFASILLITVLTIVDRTANTGQPSTPEDPPQESVKAEDAVLRALSQAQIPIELAQAPDADHDFIATIDGRTTLIEVRPWRRALPLRLLSAIMKRYDEAIRREHAEAAIIVTAGHIDVPQVLRDDTNVRILSLKEFEALLAKLRKPAHPEPTP